MFLKTGSSVPIESKRTALSSNFNQFTMRLDVLLFTTFSEVLHTDVEHSH
jgi:hypothetical protein